MRAFAFITLLAALAAPAAAQHEHGSTTHSPYTDLQTRAIKALSETEVEDLKAGNGMGFALAAELNGVPGPKHVLELDADLKLSAEQRTATQALFDRMNEQARTLGAQLIEAEGHLDGAFATGSISAESLAMMTSHIGRIRGELRAVHLGAHLEMRKILSEEQVHAYNMARGYHEGH